MAKRRKGPSPKRIIFLLLATVVLIFVIYRALMASIDTLMNSFFVPQQEQTWDSDKFINKDGFKAYDDENVETMIGIDVSDHQKEIDWKEVKAAGIDFAIIRVGYRGAVEGILHEDKYFQENMKEAIQNGIPVGVYFFSSAITEEEAVEEADYVNSLINDYKISGPVVFDMEPYHNGGRIDDLTKEEKTSMALTFCEKIEEHGYHPMVYGNKHWFTNDVDLEQLSHIPIWYAAYQEKPSFSHPFTMWQYSATATLPGIETDVDMNIALKKK